MAYRLPFGFSLYTVGVLSKQTSIVINVSPFVITQCSEGLPWSRQYLQMLYHTRSSLSSSKETADLLHKLLPTIINWLIETPPTSSLLPVNMRACTNDMRAMSLRIIRVSWSRFRRGSVITNTYKLLAQGSVGQQESLLLCGVGGGHGTSAVFDD